MRSTKEAPAAAESRDKHRESDESAQREIFESLVQKATDKYRRALRATDSITDRDLREYEYHNHLESSWNALGADTYEKRAEFVRDSIHIHIPDLIQTTLSLEERFNDGLAKACEEKWINEESATKWKDKLKSEEWQHWEKSEFMKDRFPRLLDNWKEVAEKRADVQKEAEKAGLTAKHIPELGMIFNVEGFLSLHYLTRKDRVAEARALVKAAVNKKESLIRFVQAEMRDWAKAGWMHPSKIGRWMERVMESDDPETFVSKVLYPCRDRWIAARKDYDDVQAAMKRDGVPQGFRMIKPEDFLLKNYKQRTSWCALTTIRMKNVTEENKRLASMKLHIRHELDMSDWDAAEEKLTEALRDAPNDRELLSMRTYLDCHRPEETVEAVDESPDPAMLLADARGLLGHITGELNGLYAEAMEEGLDVFEYFEWIVRNRVWVHENGYSTEELDIVRAQDEENKMQTEEYIEHGHSNRAEHNILRGDTAHASAIRDDCTKPQTLYVSGDGRHGFMHKVKKNARAQNAGFPYWTTAVFTNASYGIQAGYVKNLHRPLKNALRKLDQAGWRFTASGDPRRKSGAVRTEPSYASAA